ncbi:MAG: 30S ribosome-binding factor RbfA [Nocardioidaceae bacterium]
MSAARARKVADRIQVIVAEMLEVRIKDARLGFVTVTDVRVTGDTQHASIFYTVLGDDEQRSATGAALESAKGMIRSEVGKQLGMRHTPTLEFILDALPESAARIEDLLVRARSSDAEVAKAAVGASYAGEVDPYKHPEDAEQTGSGPTATELAAGPTGAGSAEQAPKPLAQPDDQTRPDAGA